MTYTLYLIIGVFAGLLSGLLGVGGGIIVVPALILLFQSRQIFSDLMIMHMAVGTSLAIMMFTSASSAVAYYRRGLVVWHIFLRFLPGLVIGLILGATVSQKTSNRTLIVMFAVFLLIVAVHLFFSKKNLEDEWLEPLINKYPNLLILSIAAICVGVLSSIFGIGGGLLMVPFFLYIGQDMRKSSGTSSICGVPIAIIGTITLTIMGWNETSALNSPNGAIGYIYWPAALIVSIASIIFAPVGARLSVFFKQQTLKTFLMILLIFSSVNLLVS